MTLVVRGGRDAGTRKSAFHTGHGLIILATRGRGRLRRALLGSTGSPTTNGAVFQGLGVLQMLMACCLKRPLSALGFLL